jgi:hypothetical protein
MRVIDYMMFLYLFQFIFSCNNVVLKNLKTHTVEATKLDRLYELGDTVVYKGVKSEIVRKRLKNGTIVKKERIITSNHTKLAPMSPSFKRP